MMLEFHKEGIQHLIHFQIQGWQRLPDNQAKSALQFKECQLILNERKQANLMMSNQMGLQRPSSNNGTKTPEMTPFDQVC